MIMLAIFWVCLILLSFQKSAFVEYWSLEKNSTITGSSMNTFSFSMLKQINALEISLNSTNILPYADSFIVGTRNTSACVGKANDYIAPNFLISFKISFWSISSSYSFLFWFSVRALIVTRTTYDDILYPKSFYSRNYVSIFRCFNSWSSSLTVSYGIGLPIISAQFVKKWGKSSKNFSLSGADC